MSPASSSPHFHSNLTGPPLGVDGSESERAAETLNRNFEDSFSEQDLIVFESDTLTVNDPQGRRHGQQGGQALAGQRGHRPI